MYCFGEKSYNYNHKVLEDQYKQTKQAWSNDQVLFYISIKKSNKRFLHCLKVITVIQLGTVYEVKPLCEGWLQYFRDINQQTETVNDTREAQCNTHKMITKLDDKHVKGMILGLVKLNDAEEVNVLILSDSPYIGRFFLEVKSLKRA